MSLDYRYDGTSNTKEWTKADWAMYNVLIWSTISVDMGKITEENIHEFVARFNINNCYEDTVELKDGSLHRCRAQITVDEIRKFIGLQTNVGTLTANQWAKKHFGTNAMKRKVDQDKYDENRAKGYELAETTTGEVK